MTLLGTPAARQRGHVFLRRRRQLGVAAGVVALFLALTLSVFIGSRELPVFDVVRALVTADNPEASEIVLNQRVPRTIIGLVAGAAIAVAGAIMQALTRNPLADPGLLGVSAGAGLGVAIGIAWLGLASPTAHGVSAFAGALTATIIVFGIERSAGGVASPARLVLAGVALAAIFGGISMALTLMFPHVFNSYGA